MTISEPEKLIECANKPNFLCKANKKTILETGCVGCAQLRGDPFFARLDYVNPRTTWRARA